MALALDENRPVATLEDVSHSATGTVEGLCIGAVQLAHAESEVWVRCLEQQVVVVSEQTIGMATPAVACYDELEGG